MASAFDKAANVIHFGDPHWPDGRKPQWILWPVWVRRMAAPSRPGERMGPFERAVLGCARARISDAEHIAGLLQIDPKLVTIIQQSLADGGYLGESRSLTDDGLSALESGELASRDIRVAHVFQCGVSGLVLPRIAEELTFAEFSRRGDRWTIERGTAAEPRPTSCFAVLPKDAVEPPIPDANEVLAAIRRHFAEQRAVRGGEAARPLTEDADRPSPVAMQRVEVIDSRARPMLLATMAYRAGLDVGHAADDYCIADPFGVGESTRIAEAIERLRRGDRQFDQRWTELFDSPRANAGPSAGIDPAEVWAMAETEVSTKLPDVPSTWGGFRHLVTMEESMVWASLAESSPQRSARLRNCAQSARAAVEACLATLRQRFPCSTLRGRVQPRGSAPMDAQILRGMMVRACISCGLGAQLPKRFDAVKLGDVVAVLVYGNAYKLTATIVVLAMEAERRPGHPLHGAAAERPDLLADLDQFLSMAGGASHDDRGSGPSVEQVKDAMGLVYWLVTSLLLQPAEAARK